MPHKVAICKMSEDGCFNWCNLTSVSMRFLNLMITPILWRLQSIQLLRHLSLRPAASNFLIPLYPCRYQFYTFFRHSSHFYSVCSSFDFFFQVSLKEIHIIPMSCLGGILQKFRQYSTHLVLSHKFDDRPRTLIAQNSRCMKDRSEMCSTIAALTRIPEDSHVPHSSMG